VIASVQQRWVLLVLALLLASCRTLPPREPSAQSWDARRSELQQRSEFELRGRIAVAAGEEGFNARLRWKQDGAHSELALDGPLGVGGVQVATDGEELNVVNARGERLDNEAARDEITARLGFEPPLTSLRYWVLGVPDPARPAEEVLDAEQRLAKLTQDGWEIEYGSYLPVNGRWLPGRLTLRREDVRVRLLVDGWHS
jgi:outer membrane lipoprotein LolB